MDESKSDFFAEWEAELETIFQRQLQDLLTHRHIFQQFAECSEPYAGTHQAAVLADWMAGNYVAFAATAIRRMVDADKRTHSLLRFLVGLGKDCSLVTRERLRQRFIERYPKGADSIAKQKADEMFDFGTIHSGDSALTTQRVEQDCVAIKKAAENVKLITNNWIAHTSRHPKIESLKYGELNDAIDTLLSVFQRYYALVTGNKHLLIPLEDFDCTSEFQKIWAPVAEVS